MKVSVQRIGRVVIGCVLLLCGVIFVSEIPALAQSHNVAIVGGTTLDTSVPCTGYGPEANNMGRTLGGCLPVVGPASEIGAFAFSAFAPAAVSAAALAPFDTIVLNVASTAMACNTATLTAQQKTDIINFVGAGKKLIIFDSECPPQDYSWLPFPFTTANPGAMGANGTLTVLQNDTMVSNNPADPNYVDAAHLGTQTDAVGDMNVMTTLDANWCVDMSGTNAIRVTGPVHTYGKFPVQTDKGLIIYNGLDQNYQGFGIGDAALRRIWLFELRQPVNPSNLPCGFTVVGITLTPPTSSNPTGGSHTVVAKLSDLLGNPRVDVAVTFSITAGPNAGRSGVCNPASCTTNSAGEVSFTYTDQANVVGTDTIEASFLNQGVLVRSQPATKAWVNPPPIAICANRYAPAGPSCTATAWVDNGSWDPDFETIYRTQTPPGPYPLGTTNVTLLVEDAHGSSSCTATVTVADESAPTVKTGTALSLLWPPDHNLINVGLQVTRSDNCTANTALSVVVYANEDDELPTADGNFSPDAITTNSTVLLRSERGGSGIGRVYLISVSAKDAAGNTGVACATVVVPQSRSAANLQSIGAAASAAQTYCSTHAGAAPAGYFVVGDGPVIGPKQ